MVDVVMIMDDSQIAEPILRVSTIAAVGNTVYLNHYTED